MVVGGIEGSSTVRISAGVREAVWHIDMQNVRSRDALRQTAVPLRQNDVARVIVVHVIGDDTLDEMRSSMRRFVEDKVSPHAHQWHLENAYVPMEIVEELAGLGVFALTLPEQYGGMGLGKVAMCVVSEELSRGWIAVGSLGTRAEIACELIMGGGTEAQKNHWLPKIAAGDILPVRHTGTNVMDIVVAVRGR